MKLIIKNVPYSQFGNKKNELDIIFNFLPDMNKIKYIVEPFAGSFALSRSFNPDKYKIIINDIDTDIYNVLIDAKKYVNLLIKTKKYFHDNNYNIKQAKEYIYNNNMIPNKFKNILFKKIHQYGYYDTDLINNNLYDDFINFVDNKNVFIFNDDYTKILNHFKNKSDVFIFCDPPYLESNNKQYSTLNKLDNNNAIIDNTEMYIYLKNFIETCKCKIMIVLNYNAIIKYIFNDNIKHVYDVVYQHKKFKTQHAIITNY